MTIILADEQKLEYMEQNAEYMTSVFTSPEHIEKLLTSVFSKLLIRSYVFQTANCDENSSMYISKAASELIKLFPKSLKEMMLGDEDLMKQVLSLVDEDHFSSQS